MSIQATTHRTVTSADGTAIGCRILGSGPALVVVHGSVATGEAWIPVAERLAKEFTLYLIDRRGRGLSGDAREYSLATEAEDISAVLAAAGDGAALLGHSYGALCALETVRRGADVSSLVLYEPPLPVEGPAVGTLARDYAAAIETGNPDHALRLGLSHILKLSMDEMDGFAATPLWADLIELAPTWTRELKEVDPAAEHLSDYASLSVPTHLLLGGDSPANLTHATEYLQDGLPEATTTVLPGQKHFAHLMDPDGTAASIRDVLKG
jgi:pimeloyl-ACP methyl ester carboxylesterase